jgi:hypothetical protein
VTELPTFTRDRFYCWLTLCPLLEWVGGKYREHSRIRWLTSAAQVLWFHQHHNVLYRWLSEPKGHRAPADPSVLTYQKEAS